MPATGSIGEIVAHGPNVMAGYYRNEAATAEVLTRRMASHRRPRALRRRRALVHRRPRQGSHRRFRRQQHLHRRARRNLRPFGIRQRDGGGRPESRPGRAGRGAGRARIRARREPPRGGRSVAQRLRQGGARTQRAQTNPDPPLHRRRTAAHAHPQDQTRRRSRDTAADARRSRERCKQGNRQRQLRGRDLARRGARVNRHRAGQHHAGDAADRGPGPRLARTCGNRRADRRAREPRDCAGGNSRTCAPSRTCNSSRASRAATDARACRRTRSSPNPTPCACRRR